MIFLTKLVRWQTCHYRLNASSLIITAIIVMATNTEADAPPEYQVRCRRYPNHKHCPGMIQTDQDTETEDIIWWCPVCNDTGVISSWQGTIWDLSDDDIEH